MPNDNKENPIIAAKNMTPWWMLRIRDFDGLEIQPCRIIGLTPQGQEIAEPCEPKQASFWTVYGHYRPFGNTGGVEAFEDFKTETEAQEFHDRLRAVYPHLADDRSQPRPQPQNKFTP